MKTLQSRNNEITACRIIIREAHINIRDYRGML